VHEEFEGKQNAEYLEALQCLEPGKVFFVLFVCLVVQDPEFYERLNKVGTPC